MRIPRPRDTVIRTHADLFRLWQGLMGPGGFSVASLWLVFLDEEQRLHPLIVPIDEIPPEPDSQFLAALVRIVADLVGSGDASSVAVLLSRPGRSAMLESDRRWARALRAELGDDLAVWPIHLATRDRVQVFAPDDLVAAAS